MSARIIDGKKIAQRLKENLKNEVEDLRTRGIIPRLAVIMVGDNPASKIYVDLKGRMCRELGIEYEEHLLSTDAAQQDLLAVISDLNHRPEINGIILQHPVPESLDEKQASELISPFKDVDGFNPVNVGRLSMGKPGFTPCTPRGVMELLKEENVRIEGAECVVVGRSNIVGKPLAFLLLTQNGTVTICHSKTRDLKEICKRADILIAAAGRPGLIRGDMIKPGAVVIDVGINRIAGTKKIVGDVDFESAVQIAGAITPVPGGVGPMTVIMLMINVLEAARKQYHMETNGLQNIPQP